MKVHRIEPPLLSSLGHEQAALALPGGAILVDRALCYVILDLQRHHVHTTNSCKGVVHEDGSTEPGYVQFWTDLHGWPEDVAFEGDPEVVLKLLGGWVDNPRVVEGGVDGCGLIQFDTWPI